MTNVSHTTPAELGDLAAAYAADGFVVAPPVIPDSLIARTTDAMDEVMSGRYETGVEPFDKWWQAGDDPNTKLRKIDQPHLANNTIYELITCPALGEAIAGITGARWLQAWTVQLLFKPPTGEGGGSVGWHQDFQYWARLWTLDSELFTAWVAISDVPADRGPVCFVPTSHRWGFLRAGDFFDGNSKPQEVTPPGARWEERPALLSAGGFSLHDKLTYHGSYPNCSDRPRRGFAIHLRTDRSKPLEGSERWVPEPGDYSYLDHLDDPRRCPIIFGA